MFVGEFQSHKITRHKISHLFLDSKENAHLTTINHCVNPTYQGKKHAQDSRPFALKRKQ